LTPWRYTQIRPDRQEIRRLPVHAARLDVLVNKTAASDGLDA
jgi:hypothetical protein